MQGDPNEIWWDPARFEEIQADFDDFWCRSTGFLQIPAIFLKIPATFAEFGDSLNRPNRPEHHPNPKPTRPSDASGRFRVPPPPTRRTAGWVRVGSKTDPTQPVDSPISSATLATHYELKYYLELDFVELEY